MGTPPPTGVLPRSRPKDDYPWGWEDWETAKANLEGRGLPEVLPDGTRTRSLGLCAVVGTYYYSVEEKVANRWVLLAHRWMSLQRQLSFRTLRQLGAGGVRHVFQLLD